MGAAGHRAEAAVLMRGDAIEGWSATSEVGEDEMATF